MIPGGQEQTVTHAQCGAGPVTSTMEVGGNAESVAAATPNDGERSTEADTDFSRDVRRLQAFLQACRTRGGRLQRRFVEAT